MTPDKGDQGVGGSQRTTEPLGRSMTDENIAQTITDEVIGEGAYAELSTDPEVEDSVRAVEAITGLQSRQVEEEDRSSKNSGRHFTITKFGRHPDGYLHARLTPAGGNPVYVTRQFGCWQAWGHVGGKAIGKEVLFTPAMELQKRARAFERAEIPSYAMPELTYEVSPETTGATIAPATKDTRKGR